MLVLAGEQAAPNLLPARHFGPSKVVILHTDLAQSKRSANNLALRLDGMAPEPRLVEAYDPARAMDTVLALLKEFPGASINITGGTKPMSLAALLTAREVGAPVFYVRSQDAKTKVDFYAFDSMGRPTNCGEPIVIPDTITIDDYLTIYFGKDYCFTGFGPGQGEAFERAIFEALKPAVDEIKAGWKHASGSVDVDLVLRCNNQIGVVEVKTGGKANSTDGIKQLTVAGGQRFFGTYVRRVLVIERSWTEKNNNRALAEALGIVLVELPGFADRGVIDEPERALLIERVHDSLGKPGRSDQD